MDSKEFRQASHSESSPHFINFLSFIDILYVLHSGIFLYRPTNIVTCIVICGNLGNLMKKYGNTIFDRSYTRLKFL